MNWELGELGAEAGAEDEGDAGVKIIFGAVMDAIALCLEVWLRAWVGDRYD